MLFRSAQKNLYPFIDYFLKYIMGSGSSVSSASMVKFSWGIVGNVIVRVYKYKGFFDQFSDVLSAKLPKNRISEMQLSWVDREYTLEDLRIIDFDTGKITDIPSVKARFQVSVSEEFEFLIGTDELIYNHTLIYGKELSPDRQAVLLELITNECRNIWGYMRSLWVKHQGLLKKKIVKHCGSQCYELDLDLQSTEQALQKYIQEKYNPDTIGQLQRRLKGKILIDKPTTRPHLIKIHKTSYAEISKNNEIQSEVHEEFKLFIFCWEDIPQLGSENLIKSEIRKLNEIIKIQLNDFSQKQRHKAKSKIL